LVAEFGLGWVAPGLLVFWEAAAVEPECWIIAGFAGRSVSASRLAGI
jgi:hypothetical protein